MDKKLTESEIQSQIESDLSEDELWGDEDDEMDREEEDNYDRACNCTCGAWIITERGNVHHVADCCCGAE